MIIIIIIIIMIIMKLIKLTKSIFYYLPCHGNEWSCSKKKIIFLSQNSKPKYLLKSKRQINVTLTA